MTIHRCGKHFLGGLEGGGGEGVGYVKTHRDMSRGATVHV